MKREFKHTIFWSTLLCALWGMGLQHVAVASLTGTLFDQIRADEDSDGYWMRVRLNVPLAFKFRSQSGFGDSLEIPLVPPTLEGGVLNELPFEDTRFPWMEFNIPVREISFNQYDRLNPRISLRFSKKFHYAYNISENGRLVSLIIKSSPITDSLPPVASANANKPQIHREGSSLDGVNSSTNGLKIPNGGPNATASASGLPQKPKAATNTASNAKSENFANPIEKGMHLITTGKYAQAINFLQSIQQIGTAHPNAKEVLELLGVAYERAGQPRTAQGVYEKFLETYHGAEDTDRVRQRLMTLASAAPMRTSLSTPMVAGNPRFSRETFGSFSQYYYHGVSDNTPTGVTAVDDSRLQTQFDVSARSRSDYYDFKGVLLGNYIHDFRRNREEHVDVNSMFADARAKRTNIGMRIGRQSSPPASGIFGKFDGISTFYQYNSRSRVLLASGYPIDFLHKDTIQTKKPLAAASVGLGPWWNTVELTPFITRQWNDGLVDRTATGFETRIGQGPFSSFTVVDVDTYYKRANIVNFNATLTTSPELTLTGTVDYRRAPLFSLSNALLSSDSFNLLNCRSTVDDSAKSIAELTRLGCTEDELRARAEKLSGYTATVAGGITYLPTPIHQFNFDASLAKYVIKLDLNTSTPENQANVTALYTRNHFLGAERNSAYIGNMTNYSDKVATINFFVGSHIAWRGNWHFYNRVGYELLWMHELPLLQNFIRPSLKLEYQDLKLHTEYNLEASMDIQHTQKGDNTSGIPDGQRLQLTAGYRWLF
ncbi:MAG: tetratricopeptide repeat protein [Gammaproteobacteria bacterium]|nr:tetratricopeptide repeat protein [Gammaproteobacteria bacterium]